jgi:hypothetical protein
MDDLHGTSWQLQAVPVKSLVAKLTVISLLMTILADEVTRLTRVLRLIGLQEV